MADRDTSNQGEDSGSRSPGDLALPAGRPGFKVGRRAVLGTAVGATAALAVGSEPAYADGTTGNRPRLDPTGKSAREAGDRHVSYHQFTGLALRAGRHDGTFWTLGGVWMARPSGTRDYTDPFSDDPTAVSYETATWTSPRVRVPFGYTELISSWEVLTPGKTWVEITVRGHDENGDLSGWYVLGRWCAKDPDASTSSGQRPSTSSGQRAGAIHRTSVDDQGTDLATVWTDTLHLYDDHQLSDWQLRVTLLRPAGSHQSPVLQTVGAVASRLPDDPTVPVSPIGSARGRVLNVPTLSQEVHDGHYPQWDNGGEAWCSATSTAMVVKYWHTGPRKRDLAWVDPPVDAEVDYAARNVFDYTYDGAGNWPFNTAYATTWGLKGFVTRLRSFTELEELIRAGIPVIISVSFEKDELDGAGYGTNGHLMVVVGFTKDGDVVVNDPASHLIADDDQVRFTYRRDQLENAWVPHSGGTVYVIHPAWLPLPRVLDHHEPNW